MDKRQRGANFTPKEKILLFDLIYKYKSIVENKKTDNVSCTNKNECWKKISEQFNAASPSMLTRSVESLRKFYENKKKEVRKQIAQEKTSGCSAIKITKDLDSEKVLDLMNKKTVHGLKNAFDSDSHQINHELDPITNEIEILDEIEDFDEDETVPSWKKYKPSYLKLPISNELKMESPSCFLKEVTVTQVSKSRRRRPTVVTKALNSSALSLKYEKLVDKKLKLVDLQEKYFELQIKQSEEKHKLEMLILKKQVDALN